jgi:hypothetical protein
MGFGHGLCLGVCVKGRQELNLWTGIEDTDRNTPKFQKLITNLLCRMK